MLHMISANTANMKKWHTNIKLKRKHFTKNLPDHQAGAKSIGRGEGTRCLCQCDIDVHKYFFYFFLGLEYLVALWNKVRE